MNHSSNVLAVIVCLLMATSILAGEVAPPPPPAPAADDSAKTDQPKSNIEETRQRWRQAILKNPYNAWTMDKLFRLHVESNTVDKMVEEYRKLADENPDVAAYNIVLARIYKKLDKYEEAAATLERIKKKDHRVLALLGKIYSSSKRYEDATRILEEAVKEVTKRRFLRTLYSDLGEVYMQWGKEEKAIATWKKIADLAPDYFPNRLKLAELYVRHTRWDEALVEYAVLEKLAGEESERLTEVFKAVGEIHEKKQDSKKAVEAYRKAIGLMAHGHWLRRELEKRIIKIYKREHRVEELVEFQKQELEKNRYDTAVWEALATTYFEIRDLENASALLSEGVDQFPSDKSLSKLYRQVLKSKGDEETLIAEYQRIISNTPDAVDLYIELGRLFASKKKMAEARRQWEKVLEKHLKNANLAARIGEVYFSYKMEKEGVEMYRRAIKLAPRDRNLYLSLGTHYFTSGRHEKALEVWNEMVEASEAKDEGNFELATVLKNYGRLEEALLAIDKAITINQKPNYLYQKAGILFLLRRYKEALPVFRQVVDKTKNALERDESVRFLVTLHQRLGTLRDLVAGEEKKSDKTSLYILAQAFDRMQRFADAVEIYKKLTKENPKDMGIALALARDYQRIRNYTRAIEVYHRLALMNPGQARHYWQAIARIYQDLEEPDKVIEYLEKIIQANPTNAASYMQVANVLRKMWRSDDAKKYYEQAIRLAPDDPKPYIQLAALLRQEGKHERAIELLRKAAAVGKSKKQRNRALYSLYNLYTSTGKLEKVLEEYRNKIDANPYDIQSHLYLADILIRGMEYSEALDVLTEILKYQPDDLSLRMKRAALLHTMQEYDDAIKEYEYALNLQNVDLDVIRESIGNVHNSAGRLDEAMEWWCKITDRVKAARKMWNCRNLEQAVKCFEEAIKLNPFKSSNYEKLAELYREKGDKKKAVEMYIEAIQRAPFKLDLLKTLGRLYIETGQKKLAVECGKRMLSAGLEEEAEEEEDEDSGGFGYYWYYQRSGKDNPLREAIDFFERHNLRDELKDVFRGITERFPKNAWLKTTFTEILSRDPKGRLEALDYAREMLREEMDLSSFAKYMRDTKIFRDRIRSGMPAYFQMDPDLRQKARETMTKRLEGENPHPEDFIEMAVIQLVDTEIEAATKTLETGLKKDPGNEIMKGVLAGLYHTVKRYDEAIKIYRELLEYTKTFKEETHPHFEETARQNVMNNLDPDFRSKASPEQIEYLVASRVYWMKKRTRGGLANFGRPDQRNILHTLAAIAFERERPEEAKKHLRELEPKDEKSFEEASSMGNIYYEHHQLADAKRLYELEIKQKLWKRSFLGKLGGSGGTYSGYGYGRSRFRRYRRYYGGYGGVWINNLSTMLENAGDIIGAYDVLREWSSYEQAEQLLERKKAYAKAIEAYGKQLEAAAPAGPGGESHEKYRKLTIKLAEIYQMQDQFENAAEIYKKYLEVNPDDMAVIEVTAEYLLDDDEKTDEMIVLQERILELKNRLNREARWKSEKIEYDVEDLFYPSMPQMQSRYYYGWGSGRSLASAARYSGSGAGEKYPTITNLALLAECYAKKNEKEKAYEKVSAAIEKGLSYSGFEAVTTFLEKYKMMDYYLPLLEKLSRSRPSDNQILLARARFLAEKGRKDEAISDYRRVIKSMGASDEVETIAQEMSRLLEDKGKGPLSEEDFLAEVDKQPKNLRARMKLLVFYLIKKDFEKALVQANKVAELAPYLPSSHRLLWYLHRITGNEEAALEALLKEIEVTSNDSTKNELYLEYGTILYAQGKKDEALKWVRKVDARLNPDTYMNIARMAKDLRLYDFALEFYLKAKEARESGGGRSYYGWGGWGNDLHPLLSLYLLTGKDNEAMAEVKKAIEKPEENRYGYGSRNTSIDSFINTFSTHKKQHLLEEYFRQRTEKEPERKMVWIQLTEYYNQSGDLDNTIALVEKFRKEKPKKTELTFLLGYLYQCKKKYKEALGLYEHIAKTENLDKKEGGTGPFSRFGGGAAAKKSRVYTEIASCLFALGNDDLAYAAWDKLIDEDKPETLIQVAGMYQSAKDKIDRVKELYARYKELKKGEKLGEPYYRTLANIYESEDNFEKAIEMYLKIREEQPPDSPWDYENMLRPIRRLHRRLRKIEDYFALVEKWYKEKPTDMSRAMMFYETLVREGENDRAIEVLEFLLKKNRKDGQIYYKLKERYEAAEQWDNLFRIQEKIVEDFSDETYNLYELGEMYIKYKDDRTKALEIFREAAQKQKRRRQHGIRSSLGNYLLSNGFLNEAVIEYRELLETVPSEEISCHKQLAVVYFRLKDYPNALAHLENAFVLEPSMLKEYGQRLQIRFLAEKTGRFETLDKELKEAEGTEDEWKSWLRLAAHQMAGHDFTGAAATLEKAIEIEPYELPLQELLLYVYAKEEDLDKLLLHSQKLDGLLINGINVLTKRKLNAFLGAVGQGVNAMSFVNKERLIFRSRDLTEYLGSLLAEKGDIDAALNQWEKLLYASQSRYYYYYYSSENVMGIARRLVKAGLYDKAVEFLDRFLAVGYDAERKKGILREIDLKKGLHDKIEKRLLDDILERDKKEEQKWSSNVSIVGILASSSGGYPGGPSFGRGWGPGMIGTAWGGRYYGGRYYGGGYYGGYYDDEDNWRGFSESHYSNDNIVSKLFSYSLYFGRLEEYQRDIDKYIAGKRAEKKTVADYRLMFLDKILTFRNDFDARLKLYDHYIEDNEKKPGFWRYLGKFAYGNGRYGLAKEYFEKYLSLRPVNPASITSNMHYIALKIGDDNMAEVYRKKVLGGDTSENFGPNQTIFNHLVAAGKYEKARDMLPLLEKLYIEAFEKRPFWRRKEKLTPFDVAYSGSHKKIYKELKMDEKLKKLEARLEEREKEVVKKIKESIAENTFDPSPHLNLGLRAFSDNKFDLAAEYLDNAAKIDPNLATIHLNRAQIHYKKKQWKKALDEIKLYKEEAGKDRLEPPDGLTSAGGYSYYSYGYRSRRSWRRPASPPRYFRSWSSRRGYGWYWSGEYNWGQSPTLLMAECYENLNMPDKAREEYLRILRENPDGFAHKKLRELYRKMHGKDVLVTEPEPGKGEKSEPEK